MEKFNMPAKAGLEKEGIFVDYVGGDIIVNYGDDEFAFDSEHTLWEGIQGEIEALEDLIADNDELDGEGIRDLAKRIKTLRSIEKAARTVGVDDLRIE